MRYGRALLAGLGLAGTLGGVALCVLFFLSAYVTLDGARPGVRPRGDNVVRLPAPDAEVPRVPLARPPSRTATGPGGRTRSGGGTVAGGAAPRSGASPRAVTPGTTPRAPDGRGRPPVDAPPPPVVAGPRPSAGSGGSPAPTLGGTARDALTGVGTQVGRVSPPAGGVVHRTGDTAGDAVDALVLPPPPPASADG